MRRERQENAVLSQELFIVSEAFSFLLQTHLPHLKYKARLPARLGRKEGAA